MNYVSANNEYHIPLNVKPIQSKKGGETNTKVIIILKRCRSWICYHMCQQTKEKEYLK